MNLESYTKEIEPRLRLSVQGWKNSANKKDNQCITILCPDRPPIPSMYRLLSIFDAISEWVGRIVAWLVLLLVLVTFAVVLLRYGFDLGWIGMQESMSYLHASAFMLGAAYTLRHDGHVRVDVIYRRLGTRGRAWIDLFGTLLLLLPFAVFMLIVSWEYVSDAWSYREGSAEAGGLPFVYLLKSVIPLTGTLLVIQALVQAGQALLSLTGGTPARDPLATNSTAQEI